MSNIVRDIVLTASDLEAGECMRTVCPFCAGGKTGERSFSVSRSEDGAVLYHCFRGKCGTSGRIGGLTTRPGKGTKRSIVRPYTGDLVELPELIEIWFRQELHIDPVGFRLAPDTWRVAMPYYSPDGTRRGLVLRSYDADAKPKAISYPEVDAPVMGWFGDYRKRDTCHVWVVEDIPSAMRLVQNDMATSSVALLGVGIHEDAKVQELALHASSITVALDPDATDIAVAAQRNLRLWFDDVRVVVLEKDIKDMTDGEFNEFREYWKD